MLNLSIPWKKSKKKQSQHKFFLFFNNVLGVLTLIIGKQILILKCKTKVISHLEWFFTYLTSEGHSRSNINIPNRRQYNDDDIHPDSWNASDERFMRYKHICNLEQLCCEEWIWQHKFWEKKVQHKFSSSWIMSQESF